MCRFTFIEEDCQYCETFEACALAEAQARAWEEFLGVSGVVSMRRSALREYGGDLVNLYNSCRLDSGLRSREAGHHCHKDDRSFKHWRRYQKALERNEITL